MAPAGARASALRAGVVLELCGDSVDDRVPAAERRLDLSALLGEGEVGAVVVGKAMQPELHKKCIKKDSLPFVAAEHFRIWHNGEAFLVQSMTTKPMWVEAPRGLAQQPAHPFQPGAQPMTLVNEDEKVVLPIEGHIVLSVGVGASNLYPREGDLANRLRWRLCDTTARAAPPKDLAPHKAHERVVPGRSKGGKAAPQDPDSDAENRCDIINGQQPSSWRPAERAPEAADVSKHLATLGGPVVPGKSCFFCHAGLAMEQGSKLGGRWYCNLDHHVLFLNHGRRPQEKALAAIDADAAAAAQAAASAAAAGPVTPLRQRRCSQPMSGTLGARRPGGAGGAGAPRVIPSKKLQATQEQLAMKERWFGPRGVEVALTCRGVVKCVVVARRAWMVKKLLEIVAARLGVASSELSVQAIPSAPALDGSALLGDILPLWDDAGVLELLWSAGAVEDLPLWSAGASEDLTGAAAAVPAQQAFHLSGAGRASAGVGAPSVAASGGEVAIRVHFEEEVIGVCAPRSWQVLDLKTEIAKRKKIALWEMKLLLGEVSLDDADSIGARFPGPSGDVTVVKPEEDMRMFEVVAPHAPSTAGSMELELRPGERLCVVEQDASGWWGGYRLQDGPDVLGWFPGNCVRRVVC